MEPLECQRHLFDLDETVTFLNGAYMSPQLKSVEEAGRRNLSLKNKPYLISVQDFFEPVESVKKQFAQLVDCSNPQRIAIIPSASYGLSNVARNVPLKAHQKIIVLQEQFPSNYYCWERVCQEKGATLHVVKGGSTQDILDVIDQDTACVSMAHVHWADGTKYDLVQIRSATQAVGAWLVVDGTQSVGALPFSIAEIQPDALVCSGYKWLMGPYGMGLAYYGKVMDHGAPIEENWINRADSHDFRNLVQYQSDYRECAARYSVGEQSNIIHLSMLEAALSQLNEWKPERIQAYCRSLNQPYLEALQQMGFQVAPPDSRAEHLLGVRVPHCLRMEDIKERLEASSVLVSYRGDSIRIAPNVYNTTEDWEHLVEVIRDYLI